MLRGTNSIHEALHASDPPAAGEPVDDEGHCKTAGQWAAPSWRQAVGRNYSRPGRPLIRGGALQALLCTSDRRAPTTMTESVVSVGPGCLRPGRYDEGAVPATGGGRFIELVLRDGRPPAGSLSNFSPARGFPSGSDRGSRVGGWPGRSLGSCLTRPVGSHHKRDPPGRPARLEVAHRVRCGV